MLEKCSVCGKVIRHEKDWADHWDLKIGEPVCV